MKHFGKRGNDESNITYVEVVKRISIIWKELNEKKNFCARAEWGLPRK